MSNFKASFKSNLKKFKGKALANGIFWFAFALLAFYVFFLFVMTFWGIITTFKSRTDWNDNKVGLPDGMYLEYYKLLIFGSLPKGTEGFLRGAELPYNLLQLYGNSILYAVGCAFFSTAVPCITAYVVAKFARKYPFLNVYTQIVLICMIIPIVGSTPSEIRIAKALHLYGKIWGIWIMKGYFLGMYFLIFQATFKGMPDGYAEAAKIDGAGHFTVFFKIYFPLTVKIFATIMLLQGITFWNDYQTPLLYLHDKTSTHTLALFLYDLQGPGASKYEGFGNIAAKLTAAVFLALPMLILFVFLNKYIMGNVSLGGLKE